MHLRMSTYPAQQRLATPKVFCRRTAVVHNEGMLAFEPASDRAFVLFGRYPESGQTKTRLAQDLGDAATHLLYQALLADTADKIRILEGCDQVGALASSEQWHELPADPLERNPFAGFNWMRQKGDDFGTRLGSTIERTLAKGYEGVVLVGTDSPEMRVAEMRGALDLVGRYDVVLGPADDGGYYLIGMRKYHAALFEGIDWSTSAVMEQTVAAAEALSLSVATVDRCSDVDFFEDLVALLERRRAAWDVGEQRPPCAGVDAWLRGQLPGQGGLPPVGRMLPG